MNLYAIISLDCFGIVNLIMILFNMRRIPGYETTDRRLFRALCYVNMAALVFDSAAWLLERREFSGAYFLLKTSNVLYYAILPLMGFIWVLYIEYKVHGDTEKLKRRAWIYIIPFAVNVVLSAANLKYDFFFRITAGNVYERGDLFLINVLLTTSYIIYTPFLLFANRRRLSRKNFLSLMLFIVPPTVTSITQLMFYGISLIFVGTSSTLMFIFITIQNDSMTTDSLTGLNNRRCLENYLRNEISNGSAHTGLTGMMIDIDDFKSINDNFGHMTGDHALEETATVISSSVRRDDFVARYAGDEFVVIIRSPKLADGERIAARLQDNITALNATGRNKYKLSMSIGVYSVAEGENTTPEAFLSRIDENMYMVKLQKKSRRSGSHGVYSSDLSD